MSRRDPLDWPAERAPQDWSERLVYRAGWWWGFASGLIVGGCSASLLTVLVYVLKAALECPQC